LTSVSAALFPVVATAVLASILEIDGDLGPGDNSGPFPPGKRAFLDGLSRSAVSASANFVLELVVSDSFEQLPVREVVW